MSGELERFSPEEVNSRGGQVSAEQRADKFLTLFEGRDTPEEVIEAMTQSGFPPAVVQALGDSLKQLVAKVLRKLAVVADSEKNEREGLIVLARRDIQKYFEQQSPAIERQMQVAENPAGYGVALAGELSKADISGLNTAGLLELSEAVKSMAEKGAERLLMAIAMKVKEAVESLGYKTDRNIKFERTITGHVECTIQLNGIDQSGEGRLEVESNIYKQMQKIIDQINNEFPGVKIWIRAAGDTYFKVRLPWAFVKDKS